MQCVHAFVCRPRLPLFVMDVPRIPLTMSCVLCRLAPRPWPLFRFFLSLFSSFSLLHTPPHLPCRRQLACVPTQRCHSLPPVVWAPKWRCGEPMPVWPQQSTTSAGRWDMGPPLPPANASRGCGSMNRGCHLLPAMKAGVCGCGKLCDPVWSATASRCVGVVCTRVCCSEWRVLPCMVIRTDRRSPHPCVHAHVHLGGLHSVTGVAPLMLCS